MRPIISECQTFMEYDNMKFMAFENVTCDGCYFRMAAPFSCACKLDGNSMMARKCIKFARTDGRAIIWMRIE